MPKETDPCKRYACAIQRCLSEKNFQEPSCQEAIKDMKACCVKWQHQSYVCDGFKSIFAQVEAEQHLESTNKKQTK